MSEPEPVASDDGDDYVDEAREDAKVQQHQHQHQQSSVATVAPIGSQRVATSLSDSLSLGIREPVYEVFFFYFPPFYLFIYFFEFYVRQFHFIFGKQFTYWCFFFFKFNFTFIVLMKTFRFNLSFLILSPTFK